MSVPINNKVDILAEKFFNYSTADTNETVEVSSGNSTFTETANELFGSVFDPVYLILISAFIVPPLILAAAFSVLSEPRE